METSRCSSQYCVAVFLPCCALLHSFNYIIRLYLGNARTLRQNHHGLPLGAEKLRETLQGDRKKSVRSTIFHAFQAVGQDKEANSTVDPSVTWLICIVLTPSHLTSEETKWNV